MSLNHMFKLFKAGEYYAIAVWILKHKIRKAMKKPLPVETTATLEAWCEHLERPEMERKKKEYEKLEMPE